MDRRWTQDELRLAVRLTGQHGYDFDKASRIMSRHGYSGRSGADIKEKIQQDRPKVWERITEEYDARQSEQLCGVRAPSPMRRFNILPDRFVEFVSRIHPDLTDGQACWAARLAGFDCNITDIRIAAKRTGYIFSPNGSESIEYSKAINEKLCVWPVGDGACGAKRERGSYCGEHYCRSLGGP